MWMTSLPWPTRFSLPYHSPMSSMSLFGGGISVCHFVWSPRIYFDHCVVGSRKCIVSVQSFLLLVWDLTHIMMSDSFVISSYLPPDPEFLSSFYDFPEIFLCLFQEYSRHNNSQVNFLTFFSGKMIMDCTIQSFHPWTHFIFSIVSIILLISQDMWRR